MRRLRESVRPRAVPGLDDLAIYSCTHSGVARQVLLAAKRNGDIRLIRVLALVLGYAIHALLSCSSEQQAILVPVSSGAKTRKKVFGDFATQLAYAWVEQAGVTGSVVQPLLHQRGAVHSQKGLSRGERAVTAADRWWVSKMSKVSETSTGGVSPRASPRPAIVIDDVVTTGATVTHAITALREAGYSVLGAASVNHRSIQRPGE